MTEYTVTRPGVYDIPEAVYHNPWTVPGGSLSCSGAKLLLPPGCPAMFDHDRREGRVPTRAMEFGTAAHAKVLGRGWPTAVGKPEWEDYRGKAAQQWAKEARFAGLIPVLAHEQQRIDAMAEAITAHPTAALLLNAEEIMAEASLFWEETEWEVPFWGRARMDAFRLPGRVVVTDYKTAVSASPDSWARSAGNFRYHMQDVWYRRAVTRTLGDADPAMLFVVQEKTPPYLVAVYELDWEARSAGAGRCEAACRIYARCVATGQWPGYQPAGELVTTVSIPRWAL